MARRYSVNIGPACVDMRANWPEAMACITKLCTMPTNNAAAASRSSPGAWSSATANNRRSRCW